MKKYLIYLFTFFFMIFCSWTTSETKILNSNSWGIRIGKKEILASWKNNEMGDTATLYKKKLKLSDTLLVQRHLCGYSGQNSITTLTFKNSNNEIIQENTNKNNQWMFTGKMPISDLLNSPKISVDQIVAIYFTISSETENINETVLLGKLRLK